MNRTLQAASTYVIEDLIDYSLLTIDLGMVKRFLQAASMYVIEDSIDYSLLTIDLGIDPCRQPVRMSLKTLLTIHY